ncbi:uncharacterized protein V6R79_000497 [Siganus canaliculatus]
MGQEGETQSPVVTQHAFMVQCKARSEHTVLKMIGFSQMQKKDTHDDARLCLASLTLTLRPLPLFALHWYLMQILSIYAGLLQHSIGLDDANVTHKVTFHCVRHRWWTMWSASQNRLHVCTMSNTTTSFVFLNCQVYMGYPTMTQKRAGTVLV